MLTIDGEQWALLPDAARHAGVSIEAMRKWMQRHQEVGRKHVGRSIVVRLQDLRGYEKRAPRSK